MGNPHESLFLERQLVHRVFSGEFRIDKQGRVWRTGILRLGKIRAVQERRAETRTRTGYLEVRATINGVRRHCAAHRLVYQYFNGDIPEGYTVNHINGVPIDNRPENLDIATMREQNMHAFRIGAQTLAGEHNNNSTLSEDQVLHIRELGRTGELTHLQISRMFGVTRSHVGRIISRKVWTKI
jgi:hypothetical protein